MRQIGWVEEGSAPLRARRRGRAAELAGDARERQLANHALQSPPSHDRLFKFFPQPEFRASRGRRGWFAPGAGSSDRHLKASEIGLVDLPSPHRRARELRRTLSRPSARRHVIAMVEAELNPLH